MWATTTLEDATTLAAFTTTASIARITPITGPTPHDTTATTTTTNRVELLDMAADRAGNGHRGLPASSAVGVHAYSASSLEKH